MNTSSSHTGNTTHGKQAINMAEIVKECRAKLQSGGKVPNDRRRRSAPVTRETAENGEIHEKERYTRQLIETVQKEAKAFRIRPRRASKAVDIQDDAVEKSDAPPPKRRSMPYSISYAYRLTMCIEQALVESQPAVEATESAVCVFGVSSLPNIKISEYEAPIRTALDRDTDEPDDLFGTNPHIRLSLD
uniref:Reverse transcriptase domain-containing protein n=1 Tax=Panagrellus redivivus TaxID=6233 RepID=A0A7E4V4E0_PANRE